jgi:hypothetical protein
VVAGVLVLPPPVAHPDTGTDDPSGHLAGPAPAEHLTAGRVMGEQSDLPEDDGQESGDGQGPPAVTDERNGGPPTDLEPGDHGDPQRVVAGTAAHQAGIGDLPRQPGEVT